MSLGFGSLSSYQNFDRSFEATNTFDSVHTRHFARVGWILERVRQITNPPPSSLYSGDYNFHLCFSNLL